MRSAAVTGAGDGLGLEAGCGVVEGGTLVTVAVAVAGTVPVGGKAEGVALGARGAVAVGAGSHPANQAPAVAQAR